MAKLDVVAKAGPAGERVGGAYGGTVLMSVARTDGSPVTGLTGGVEIYLYFDANITSGSLVTITNLIEEATQGRGEPGVYFTSWYVGEKGSTYPLEGVYYVTVTVRDGADVGQTVASYYVAR